MTIWVFLSGIIAPALFWAGYFYSKDRFRPEPIKALGAAYLLGWAAAAGCLGFFEIMSRLGLPDDMSVLIEGNRLWYLSHSILVTGLVEEFFKLLPFILVIVAWRTFDEPTDGIVYASMIALGFASFENLFLLPALTGFALFGRAFASPLTHTIFASFWGYTVGRAVLEKHSLIAASLRGLIFAAFCHGTFNFLTSSRNWRFASALLILSVWIWRIWYMEREGRGRRPKPPRPGTTPA